MRTLVIPDVHHQVAHADHWLSTQSYDKVVFLGDFFDHFEDSVEEARQTAEWLRPFLNRNEALCIMGNHDLHYWQLGVPDLRSPGFTPEKAEAINKILNADDWLKFRLAHYEQGWLMSHAGFHPVWLKDATSEKILQRCELAVARARSGVLDPVFAYGELPGGLQRFGGPFAMNWGSLVPIPGISQIVGHTSGDIVRERSTGESRNICLDVGNASVAALLVDGELQLPRR